MRVLPHVIGMFVLGVAALLVPGWLYQTRVMAPAPANASGAARPTGTAGRNAPAATILLADTYQGIRANLDTFVHQIGGGDRRAAMHALDAAYQLATVARAASGGAATPIYLHVVAARRAVQNHEQQAAFSHALSAATTDVPAVAAPPPAALDAYEGATVLIAGRDATRTRAGCVGYVAEDCRR